MASSGAASCSSSTSIDASKNEPGSSNPNPNLSVDSYTPSLPSTAGATTAVAVHRNQPDPTTRSPPAPFEDAPPSRQDGGDVKAQPDILQGSSIQPLKVQGSSNPTPGFQENPKASRPRPEYQHASNTVPFQPRTILSEIRCHTNNACAAMLGILSERYSPAENEPAGDEGPALRAGVNRFMNALMTSTFPPFASVMEFQPSYPKPFLETHISEQLEKEQGRPRKGGRKRKRAEAASTERKRKRAEMVQLPQMRTILNLMNGYFGALVLNRHRGFEKAIKSLQIQLDASKVGIEDAIAASRVALFGVSPVPTGEGNRICQTIHDNIIGALLLSGFGSTLFANETRSGIPDYMALEFTSPAQLADYRSEIYCRVLSVWVNALEIATNARALAIAGVEGWYELGPDEIRASADLFVDIVRQHENKPTAATLATKGARHLAACSDVAWTVLRGALPRELLEAVRRFGAEQRHAMLEEEATKLLETLHPDEAA